MPNKPTLRDVAQLAKVSLGTASQALSNKPGVLPETRAKVIDAARTLGYQHIVRTLSPASKSLNTIGLLTKTKVNDPPRMNPFYSHVLAGVEHECRRMHLNLMFATIEVDENSHATSLPPMLIDQRVDGVLIVGAFLENTLTSISKQYMQSTVLVDSYVAGQSYDSVVIDNVNGAQAAVEYLIQQGHRQIGLVGSYPNDYPSIAERRKGYIRAMRENSLDVLYIEDSPLQREGGYEGTMRLLERAPEVTAIFACNDDVALGVLQAAHELGLRVPDDLSVIGFDDIDLAQQINPPLTTMHVDKALMGALAVKMLQDRAENPNRPTLTTSVSAKLIVRETVLSV